MSEEILNKMLDLMVETREKLAGIDNLTSEVAKVNLRLERIERTVDGHTARFDRIERTLGEHTVRFDKVDERLDRVEERLDNVESELGTAKDAMLDVSRTVRSHDLAIKEIKERYH